MIPTKPTEKPTQSQIEELLRNLPKEDSKLLEATEDEETLIWIMETKGQNNHRGTMQ